MVSFGIQRILTICFWGLLVLGGAELAFRFVVFPEYTSMLPDMFQRHPVLGYYNKPNIEVRRYNPMNFDVINHTNAMGFRGREENREKELSGIWVAGSSNTFGGFVEDNEVYVAQLRKYGYWAANLGSEGHNIDTQSILIRYLGKQGYRPKAVILALPVLHAIQDYTERFDALSKPLRETTTVVERTVGLPSDELWNGFNKLWLAIPRSFKAVRGRLLESSALYGGLKVGIMNVPMLRAFTLKIGFRADIDLINKMPLDLLRPLDTSNPAWRAINTTAEFVAATRAMIQKEFGVPVGVVLLPSYHLLYPEAFQRYVNHFNLQKENLDPWRALSAFKVALAERNVPVFDTLAGLRKKATGPLTFPDNGHLNAEGHTIVAKEIAAWLKSGMKTAQPVVIAQ